MEDKRLNEWEEIEKKIEQSKIKRYPYKKLLGESLTARIHRLRAKGHNSYETYSILIRNPKIQEFLARFPLEANKMMENLKVSVCARFAEQNMMDKRSEDAK